MTTPVRFGFVHRALVAAVCLPSAVLYVGAVRASATDFASAEADDSRAPSSLTVRKWTARALMAGVVFASREAAAQHRPGTIGLWEPMDMLKDQIERAERDGRTHAMARGEGEFEAEKEEDGPKIKIKFMPDDLRADNLRIVPFRAEHAGDLRVREILSMMQRAGSLDQRLDPASTVHAAKIPFEEPIEWHIDFHVTDFAAVCTITTGEGQHTSTQRAHLSLVFLDGEFLGLGAEVSSTPARRGGKPKTPEISKYYFFQAWRNYLIMDVAWAKDHKATFRYTTLLPVAEST